MALVEQRFTSDGIVTYDKVAVAIQNLKDYEQIALQKTDDKGRNGYYVCISGGKDSSVIQQLCIMAGVKCQFYHNHTGLDHPETVYFVRRERDRLKELGYDFFVVYPRKKIGQLVIEKGILPTRLVRYCCSELKEGGGSNRFIVTGVRRAESTKRADAMLVEIRGKTKKERIIVQNDNTENRKSVEHCPMKGTLALNVILEWSDEDVWEFIRKYDVPYNPLYDQGYKRVGCVGCPMSTHKREELEANPKYKQMWLKRCQKLVDTGKIKYKTAEELYDWWTEKDKRIVVDDNQNAFDFEFEEDEE